FVGPGQDSWFEVHNGQLVVDYVRNNLIYSGGNPYWGPWKSGESGDWRACTNSDTTATCPNFAGSNNLVVGSGAATFTNILTNNVNLNPNFTNLTGLDFHLQSNSPAIGAGTPISGLLYDIEGNPRGSTPSIGAFELPGGVAQTVVATLSSLTCNTPSIVTPLTDTCTVGLTGNAPAAGFLVTLSSNSLSLLLPASVTIRRARAARSSRLPPCRFSSPARQRLAQLVA